MKAILRSPPIQIFLASLIWFYMATIGRTLRWTVEGEDAYRDIWAQDGGIIFASWHSRILLLPAGWTRFIRKLPPKRGPLAILVSHSRDGQFVAKASKMLGLAVIRGSSANKKKRKDKGGAAAIRETGELLASGGAVCMTVDGPRGPRQRASMGAILLARKKKVPIMIYAQASSPAFRLGSWDRFLLPMPFGKGALIFEGPIDTGRSRSAEDIRQEVEDRLNAATERAEAMVGLSHLPPEPLDAGTIKTDAVAAE